MQASSVLARAPQKAVVTNCFVSAGAVVSAPVYHPHTLLTSYWMFLPALFETKQQLKGTGRMSAMLCSPVSLQAPPPPVSRNHLAQEPTPGSAVEFLHHFFYQGSGFFMVLVDVEKLFRCAGHHFMCVTTGPPIRGIVCTKSPPPTSPPYLPPPLPPPPYLPPLPPPPLPPPPTFGSLRSTDGSLRSTRGPAPAPPLNNMTPAVATYRLLCAPPCVCTAFCVYRLACGPLNNKTPAVATGRLVCVPPCVCTAFCVYRLACGPLNNKTPAVATDRLLCVPPCVCTAFCMHRLACGPLNNKTPAVATGRLLCVPPCVCTAFCVYRLACGP